MTLNLTNSFSSTSSYAQQAQTPYPVRPTWHWDSQSTGASGSPGNFEITSAGNTSGNLAPYSQPTRFGYDVTAPQISLARRNAAYRASNGVLSDGSFQYPMFVDDVSIDIALAGSTAQSILTRDFYARNFVLPAFTISGQTLDQDDYGMLCEFVHQAQRKAVKGGWQQLTQLQIKGWGFDGNRKTGYGVTRVTPLGAPSNMAPSTKNVNQTLRGSHKPILCKGIVASMPRTHEVGVPAPTYQFQFIVLAMLHGIYSEPLDVSVAENTWINILQQLANEPNVISTYKLSGKTRTKLLQQNTQVLKTANKGQNQTIASSLAAATAASGTQAGN